MKIVYVDIVKKQSGNTTIKIKPLKWNQERYSFFTPIVLSLNIIIFIIVQLMKMFNDITY